MFSITGCSPKFIINPAPNRKTRKIADVAGRISLASVFAPRGGNAQAIPARGRKYGGGHKRHRDGVDVIDPAETGTVLTSHDIRDLSPENEEQ